MCFISAMGWLFGRKRWWAGPYCTGFIGFGDGSAAEVPPERLLKSWGISTVSEDLYFDAKKWTPKEPPVRLARELVLMGYRGRSDDPIVRPGMAAGSKAPPWQCPSSAPVPPQGAPDGSGQLRTPRVRPSHRGLSHCLGCSSQPPPESPVSLLWAWAAPRMLQARLDRRQRVGPQLGKLVHVGVDLLVVREAGPECSKAVESAALEAARSSNRGSGWAPSGWASPWECQAAQSRQARHEEAQEPSLGATKGPL